MGISKFLEIVKKEQHQKKQKKQKKDSKKKPKKDININANIKEQKRKQQQQQPPPTKPKVAVPATKKKYVPQKISNDRVIEKKSNIKPPTKPSKPASAPKTFAEKMRAKKWTTGASNNGDGKKSFGGLILD